jgi:hypothetical protein
MDLTIDPSSRIPLLEPEVARHRQRQYVIDMVFANVILFVAEASRGLVLGSLLNVRLGVCITTPAVSSMILHPSFSLVSVSLRCGWP